jgi:hypothetical protein
MTSARFLIVIVCSLCLAIASSEEASKPAIDKRALQGHVIGPHGPVANCLVQIAKAEPHSDFSPETLTDVWTDDEGRFTFKDLESRKYELRLYRTDLVSHGSTRIGGDATVSLEQGNVSDLTLHMFLPSTISGTVVDDLGAPVYGATVMAMSAVKRRHSTGETNDRFWVTDDEGHFRISGLAPGSYYIVAVIEDEIIKFVLNAPSTKTKPRQVLTPGFYPDASDLAQARPLRIVQNSSTTIRLVMWHHRLTTVDGELTGLEGEDQVDLQLHYEGEPGEQQSQSQGNGKFHFDAVAPGRYSIDQGDYLYHPNYLFTATFDVPESGASDVRVAATRNIPLGDVPIQINSDGDAKVNVFATPLQCVNPFIFLNVREEEGQLLLRVPGSARYRFELSGGRAIKEMRVDGTPTDPSDALISTETSLIEITAGSGPTSPLPSISGKVINAFGTPLPGTTVVLIRADDKTRCADSVVAVATDQSGEFTFNKLASKRYRIFALDSLNWTDLRNQASWKIKHEQTAVDIELKDGQQRILNLKSVPF